MSNPILLGGNFTFNGSAPLTLSGPATLTNSVSLTVNNATTFAGAISEFGASRSLTDSTGVGTLTLGSNNTFTGGFVLATGTLGTAGSLVVTGSNTSDAGPLGIGQITLTSGVLEASGPLSLSNILSVNPIGTGSPLTFSGSTISFTGPITISGTSSSSASNVLDVTNTTTFAGVIQAGSNSITQSGPGTLAITSASSSYTGTVNLTAGNFSLSGDGTIGSTSITVNNGSTLTLDDTGTDLPEQSGSTGRLPSTVMLVMNGGTFNFLANLSDVSSEALGTLSLSGGNSTISTDGGGNDGPGSTLSFSLVSRPANGGTVDFVAPAGSAAIGSGLNQVVFGNSSSVGEVLVNSGVDNIVPYATVTGPSGSFDFASILGTARALVHSPPTLWASPVHSRGPRWSSSRAATRPRSRRKA